MTTQAALEAARVLTSLMASPACPRVLVQQQLLEATCRLVTGQLQANLLSFCDMSVRRDCRADWESLPALPTCASSFESFLA
jgi:hypothetical protein